MLAPQIPKHLTRLLLPGIGSLLGHHRLEVYRPALNIHLMSSSVINVEGFSKNFGVNSEAPKFCLLIVSTVTNFIRHVMI
jgi:hypothetical protein